MLDPKLLFTFLIGSISGATLIYVCFGLINRNSRLSLEEAKKPFRELAKDWLIRQDGDYRSFAGQLVTKARDQEKAHRELCWGMRKVFALSKDLNERALVEAADALRQKADRLSQGIQEKEQQLEEAGKRVGEANKLSANTVLELASTLKDRKRAEDSKTKAERALEAEKERAAMAFQAERLHFAEREEAFKRKEFELQQRESELQKRLRGLDVERRNLREQVEKDREDVEQERKEAEKQMAKARELEETISAKQSIVDDYPSQKARVEWLNREHEKVANEREALRRQFNQMRAEFDALTVQHAEATNKLTEQSAETASVRGKLDDTNTKISTLARERDALMTSEEKLKSTVGSLRQKLVLPRTSLPEFIVGGVLQDYGTKLLDQVQRSDEGASGAQARRIISALFALEAEMAPGGDSKFIFELLSMLGRYLYAWMEASNTDAAQIDLNAEKWASVISDYCSSRRIRLKVFRVGEPINLVQMNRISGNGPSVSRIESWLVLHNDGIVRKALVYA